MPTKPSYAELVAEAERAVQGVKDAELRRVAFEKILDDLLGGGSPTRTEKKSASKKKATTAKSKTPKKASPGRGPKAYITRMIDEGYFKKTKTIAQVKAELENQGHHIPLTSLSGPLQKLCQERRLRRQKKKQGNKETYVYSEW